MKFQIKHKSRGRLRVHMCVPRMLLRRAYLLEYYLIGMCEITEVNVYGRKAFCFKTVFADACSCRDCYDYHFVFEDEKCSVPDGESDKLAELNGAYSYLYLAVSGVLAAVICISERFHRKICMGL